MTSHPDWQAIRAEYEQGSNLRTLAAKYGVPKSTIGLRKQREQWDKIGQDTPPHTSVQFPVPHDALSIAQIGLQQLGQSLGQGVLPSYHEHKLISDALAQYVKVLVTAPSEGSEQEDGLFIPFSKLSSHTRREIRQLLVEDEQMRGRAG